jgi:hypothetical protein
MINANGLSARKAYLDKGAARATELGSKDGKGAGGKAKEGCTSSGGGSGSKGGEVKKPPRSKAILTEEDWRNPLRIVVKLLALVSQKARA